MFVVEKRFNDVYKRRRTEIVAFFDDELRAMTFAKEHAKTCRELVIEMRILQYRNHLPDILREIESQSESMGERRLDMATKEWF